MRVLRIFAVYFFLTPVTILSAQSSLTVEIINLDPKEQRLGLSLAEGE